MVITSCSVAILLVLLNVVEKCVKIVTVQVTRRSNYNEAWT